VWPLRQEQRVSLKTGLVILIIGVSSIPRRGAARPTGCMR